MFFQNNIQQRPFNKTSDFQRLFLHSQVRSVTVIGIRLQFSGAAPKDLQAVWHRFLILGLPTKRNSKMIHQSIKQCYNLTKLKLKQKRNRDLILGNRGWDF